MPVHFNVFGQEPATFCSENNLFISDQLLLPSGSDTYLSEEHATTSWLDHSGSTDFVQWSIEHVSVKYNYISSDHFPLRVNLDCSVLPSLDQTRRYSSPERTIGWSKLFEDELLYYMSVTDQLVDMIIILHYITLALPADPPPRHTHVIRDIVHYLHVENRLESIALR